MENHKKWVLYVTKKETLIKIIKLKEHVLLLKMKI